MDYPNRVKAFIGSNKLSLFNQGQSLASLYHFVKDNESFVLKVQPVSKESHQEVNMLKLLSEKQLAPKVFVHTVHNKIHYIIMEHHKDKTLDSYIAHKPIDTIIDIALDGLNQLAKQHFKTYPSYPLESRLEDAYHLIKSGQVKTLDDTPYTRPFKDPMTLYYYLLDNKPLETLTLVHGDYCLDNILSNGKKVTGFIDLGRGGLSDIYQDLALLVRELSVFDPDVVKKISERLTPLDDHKLTYYLLLDELF